MIPLVALLMGLTATAAASDPAWRRQERIDTLRQRLGLWKLEAFPGSIARRLEWIRQQFGIDAAVAATRVAVLIAGSPYNWNLHEHEGTDPEDQAGRVAIFLPWFAWRWTKGDVPEELRRVLMHPGFGPTDEEGKHLPYDKDAAWSRLASLIEWADRSNADLFQHTWKQAEQAEETWFPTSLKPWNGADWNIPRGELIFRFPWEDEDGPWTVERHDDYDDIFAIRKALHMPPGSSRDVIDVLKKPNGEPMVVIDLTTRYSSREVWGINDIRGEYNNSTLDWTQGDDEDLMGKLRIYLEHEFGEDPSSWGNFDGAMIAVFTSEGDEQLKLLEEYPELFSRYQEEDQGASRYIADNVHDFDHRFAGRWAQLANAYPNDWPILYSQIAGHQVPTERLIEWMKTGKWDDTLAENEIPYGELEERLPGIIRQFEYSHNKDEPGDINSTSGEHDQVLPWEIKLWDVYKHPGGAELEVKLQVFVWFDWDNHTWVTSAKMAAQFRPTPDASTWDTSEGFEDFEFTNIVQTGSFGYRELDSQAMRDLEDDPFETQGYGTTSLDEALKEAWEFVSDLDNAELEEDEWKEIFPNTVLANPGDLEITDLYEALELLGNR